MGAAIVVCLAVCLASSAVPAACTPSVPAAPPGQASGSGAALGAGSGSLPPAGRFLADTGRLLDSPVSSSGCGRRPAIRPGSTGWLSVAVPPGAAQGARVRSSRLHVPRGYQPGRLVPLVLAFHGGGGTGGGMGRASMLSATADRQGFLVAYPQALKQGHGHYAPGWDSSGPTDRDAGGIDDGLFVSDLLTVIQAGYCVDPARVWATGLSNGGSMVGYLACALAGRIAAVAPVEGVFFQIPGGCHPARPVAILAVHAGSARIAARAIRVFRVPAPGALPFDIAAGPDGSMWFTEFAADKIGRISGTGVITEFTVPTANAGPYQITAGAGGAMWFTEYNTTKIGRISGDGTIREFQIPAPSYGAGAITGSGPGPVFAADPAGFVDVVSPQGAMTRIKVPSAAGLPFDIARLSGGALWLSELTGFYEFSRHLIDLRPGQGTPTLPVTLPNLVSNVVALAAGPASTSAAGTGPSGSPTSAPARSARSARTARSRSSTWACPTAASATSPPGRTTPCGSASRTGPSAA